MISSLNGFDWIEPYGHQRLIPTFKGWHQGLQRQVIVRLLRSSAEVTDSIQQRALETLIDQVIQFQHPGIIKWFKLEEIALQNNRFYCLINEWFSDESLKDWLVQYGPLNEENVLLTAEHIVNGLTHYWNRCHIAHGNLKPENILINKEGNLKVDKFGLTALLALTALKGEEVSIGTPAFMAPELIAGCTPPNDLSDIYALGMTISCLLTGLQSAAREPEERESHLPANMPVRISMSPEMGKIIRHMTAARPEDRFPSWEAVHEAIKEYEQSHTIKSDQNNKTQTIKIPICDKNITRIFGVPNTPNSSRAIKVDEVSKTSTHIIPVMTGTTPKLKKPISDPTVEAHKKWVVRQISGLWIMAAAAFLVLIAVIVMWYLRSAKEVDVLKPLHSRITMAYSKNMVLVKRDDWNSLTSDVNRLNPTPFEKVFQMESKSSQQTLAIQTNVLAAGMSCAKENAGAPKPDTVPPVQSAQEKASADGKFSRPGTVQIKTEKPEPVSAGQSLQSGTTDQVEKKETQDQHVQQVRPPSPSLLIQPENGAKKETISNRVQDVPSTSETTDASSVTAPEGGTEDPKLVMLMKRMETGDTEAQCELGDYYASIDDKNNAFEWYRKAAERNLPKGLCRYGKSLMTGEGTRTNQIEAVEMFKKAAALNDPEGQCLLADCLFKGQGVPRNQEAAVQMFQFAAAQTNAEAYCRLGECALNGIGMDKNVNQAMLFFKKSADMNYSPAYYQMGEAYAKGLSGVPNPTTALSMYKKAAEMNNIRAQYQLVLYYDARAKSAPSNRAELVQRLRATATNSVNGIYDEEEKTMLSQIYILYGDCLVNGTYMNENLSEGVRMYEKAAKTGNFEGAYKYGLCLLNGRGVQQNESEGFNLLMTAAKGEYAKAMWMVGESYLNGKGVARDSKQAELWFGKAANNNVPEAQYRMGELCLDGANNESNNKKAFEWFQKAANEGYAPAIEKMVECCQKGIGTKKSVQNAMLWRNQLSKGRKEKKSFDNTTDPFNKNQK